MAQPSFSAREPSRIALWPKAVNGVATPRVCLDGTWKLTLHPPDEPYRSDVDCAAWSDVQVPGELAMHGFDIESDTAYPYKRMFAVPEDFAGCQVILRFESVHSDATVWVNGIQVGRHCGTCDSVGLRYYGSGRAGRGGNAHGADRRQAG